MSEYRVYKLNPAGRIVSGEWILAPDDGQARTAAHAFCDEATPTVELWCGPRFVARLPCDEAEPATTAHHAEAQRTRP